ncbi:response regulator [Crossiella sp. NPDC003009]
MPPPLRILIADDHPLFRIGLRDLLRGDGHEIVGLAADGFEAVRLAAETAPHLVLMDLAMPIMDGYEATTKILARDPSIRVVVLTVSEDQEAILKSIKAGATGYLLKGAGPTELRAAIDQACTGEPLTAPAPPHELTDREHELLRLLAKRLDTATIAEHLLVSPKTVRNTISRLQNKLGLPDRHALIRYGVQLGLDD